MLTIRKLADGELAEVTIAPVGYQASEDELAAMYAALFGQASDCQACSDPACPNYVHEEVVDA